MHHKFVFIHHLMKYTGKPDTIPEATATKTSPRKLRKRVPRKKSSTQLDAERFEKDFDSPNPSESIQFKRN